MRCALVTELGRPPELGGRPDPEAADGEVVVEVEAAALNPLDLAVGAGRHYLGHPPLPYVPGSEAVGRVDGRRVWAFGGGLGLQRDGTVAERVAVARERVFDVREDVEPALACALGIAGLAGWMPVSWRAPVREDDVVLVLGATGAAGLVAVQAARALGARRVVAAGRDPERLRRAEDAGAAASVRLDEHADLASAFRDASGGDGPTLVVDFLWGEPARAAAEAAAPGARIVHVGQSAGPEATLASAAVRGKQLLILGYSDFGLTPAELADGYASLLDRAAAGDIRLDIEMVALEDVAGAWSRQAEGGAKLVLMPVSVP